MRDLYTSEEQFRQSQADSPQRSGTLTLKRQGCEGGPRLCSNRADIRWLRPPSTKLPLVRIERQIQRVAVACSLRKKVSRLPSRSTAANSRVPKSVTHGPLCETSRSPPRASTPRNNPST